MLTKIDREQLRKDFEKIFVTKEGFNQFGLSMNKAFDDMVELIKDVRDSIVAELSGEINSLKLELRDGVEDHDRRIEKLEETIYEN